MEVETPKENELVEFTPRRVRKLAAVVGSWKMHPGPETTLRDQAVAALERYAKLLDVTEADRG